MDLSNDTQLIAGPRGSSAAITESQYLQYPWSYHQHFFTLHHNNTLLCIIHLTTWTWLQKTNECEFEHKQIRYFMHCRVTFIAIRYTVALHTEVKNVYTIHIIRSLVVK